MKTFSYLRKNLFIIFFGVLISLSSSAFANSIRVLILTGSNNHDWAKTTPQIVKILDFSSRFEVRVVENPAEMNPLDFEKVDVVLSNFNLIRQKNLPDPWSDAMKKAFTDFIASGKGFLGLHAGSSVFYDWSEFQKIAGGTWKNGSHHGKMHAGPVQFSGNHLITRGLLPFYTYDEFWEDVWMDSDAVVIAKSCPQTAFNGSGKNEVSMAVTSYSKGRGVFLALGHDTRSLQNTAFKTLLLRGTEWAATGEVTIPPLTPWPVNPEMANEQAGVKP